MNYRSFEDQLRLVLDNLRTKIANETSENSIIFSIKASGRVDGDLEIEFSIEQQFGSDFDVKGGHLEPVLVEFCRRAGWQVANKPVCLPKVVTPTTPPRVERTDLDDEIPF